MEMELSITFGKMLLSCGIGALLMVLGKSLSIFGYRIKTVNYFDVYCVEIGDCLASIGAFIFFFSLLLMLIFSLSLILIWTGATTAH